MKSIKTVSLIGLGAIGTYLATQLKTTLGNDLRIIAGFLFLSVGGNTGIDRYTLPSGYSNRHRGKQVSCCQNRCDPQSEHTFRPLPQRVSVTALCRFFHQQINILLHHLQITHLIPNATIFPIHCLFSLQHLIIFVL